MLAIKLLSSIAFWILIGYLINYLWNLPKYVIMREACNRISQDLLRRMAKNHVTFDDFECLKVSDWYLRVVCPYSVEQALGLDSTDYKFRRDNGGEVWLRGGPKQREKMAKYFISALNMTGYTCVQGGHAIISRDSYTSEVRSTGSGVEVATRPSSTYIEEVIICRQSDVSKYAPKKTKTYRL